MIHARYLLETPLDPESVAAMMAGEQSAGTFVRVPGETDELRERHGARVQRLTVLGESDCPTLASAYLERKGVTGPWRRAEVEIAYPEDNVGVNLPTLAAVVAGNLFDLGEVTALKLLDVTLRPEYRARYPLPAMGIEGTRRCLDVHERPLFGTIIKPNIGMSPADIARLVQSLCEAGVDFIKDDEIVGNPACAPVKERVDSVMKVVRDHRERTGKEVMVAFNITDELDAMRRHADHVLAQGGNCVMASLNWCGLSAIQALRQHTPLCLHGHRNGSGAFGRHPAHGIAFPAWQTLYRLAGADHLHVHGMGGKFADATDEVALAARRCLTPLGSEDDRVLPVFSSGQWAGTLPSTHARIGGSQDFLFLAGGGILAHPEGPRAGVESLRAAWEAVTAGEDLRQHAKRSPALARALDSFGSR
ncbi:ribulose-bisphosphate carboxylase large subunit family protein [Halomonas elongata]|uniref:Ribulose-bisphosphate carboxylase domain protein n=1 Tax=Halomonas elongata (strain ATCC 33173 / DSM 2581 / NBRC 15536 / NCIMB 2198 / 1H9) TaxID=768066 RepID=E1V6N5_HALED|nr:ribulose-bisphosphate carboxylase large subunit family protein [Halomonas elongata]WBF18598.1 ribulose-bisphosphate carboxylase large subunit family protein [Halomonas elongata]WPU47452.1 ribulose-bisphosphate carboxylase large subunit family protein [Halomonas elongata DSM 2581]CBV41364.1 ribulose-bisphosphate carboxylase domain protein [Halomonas elongata DSM 2581]